MRITRKQLEKLIKEEVGAIISLDSLGSLPVSVGAMGEPSASFEEQMVDLLGCLRSAGVWFHAAHNLSKGTGFAGDHVNIYGEIYDALVGDYDGAAEKAVGISDDESVACPHKVMAVAIEKMDKYSSPSGASAAAIASTALQIVRDLNDHVESLFASLEADGELPLGLNDFLAAAANDYTKYIYLLQQRVKES
jgi:hypothetical protein